MDADLARDASALAHCAIELRAELAGCGLPQSTWALVVRGAILGEKVRAVLSEEITSDWTVPG